MTAPKVRLPDATVQEGCPIPVCDECRRYWGYTRIHVVDGVCSFGHRDGGERPEHFPGCHPDDAEAEQDVPEGAQVKEFVSSLDASFEPGTRWQALKDYLTAQIEQDYAVANSRYDGGRADRAIAAAHYTLVSANRATLAKMAELESGTASQERAEDKGRHPAAVIVRCDELREGDRLLESDAMVTVLRVDTYTNHLGISVWAEEGRRWYLDRQPSSLVAVCRASQGRTGDGEPQ